MLPELIEDPLALLREDLQRARGHNDRHASSATLATVEDDQPALRVVTLRLHEDDRLLVSANATSPKAHALRRNPRCELLFYWASLQRQYRLRGAASFVSAAELPELYRHVPWRSKTWDHVYESLPQSTPVQTRSEFVAPFREQLSALQARHPSASEVPATLSAGYLAVVPDAIDVQELDLEERLHDRRLFTREGEGPWVQTLLVP